MDMDEDFCRLRDAWATATNFKKEAIISRMEKLGAPEAEEFIRNVLSDGEEYYHVRGWAARSLRKATSPGTVTALVHGLEWGGDPFIRSMCADSIAKNAEFINALGREARERVLTALRQAASDGDFGVQKKAVLALARLRDRESMDAMVKVIRKIEIEEGITDYEEISLALCEMGRVEMESVIAFSKTLRQSRSQELSERMLEAAGELLKKKRLGEMWRGELMAAMRVRRNKLAIARRPPGESFVDDKLGARFTRPSIAMPVERPSTAAKKPK